MPAELPIKVTIAKLQLRPGDFLVIRYQQRLTTEQIARIKADLDNVMPAGVKTLVFTDGAAVEVLSPQATGPNVTSAASAAAPPDFAGEATTAPRHFR